MGEWSAGQRRNTMKLASLQRFGNSEAMKTTPGDAPNNLLGLRSLPVWTNREVMVSYMRMENRKRWFKGHLGQGHMSIGHLKLQDIPFQAAGGNFYVP